MVTQKLKEEFVSYLVQKLGMQVMEIDRHGNLRYFIVLSFDAASSDRRTHMLYGYEITSVIDTIGSKSHFDNVGDNLRVIVEKNEMSLIQFSEHEKFFYHTMK